MTDDDAEADRARAMEEMARRLDDAAEEATVNADEGQHYLLGYAEGLRTAANMVRGAEEARCALELMITERQHRSGLDAEIISIARTGSAVRTGAIVHKLNAEPRDVYEAIVGLVKDGVLVWASDPGHPPDPPHWLGWVATHWKCLPRPLKPEMPPPWPDERRVQ